MGHYKTLRYKNIDVKTKNSQRVSYNNVKTVIHNLSFKENIKTIDDCDAILT